MLESMRKHAQGWLAKVILGAIILSFALWGIGDYFTGNQIETVAEIDGEAINHVEFLETYQRQLNSYSSMIGKQFTKEMADKLGVKEETVQTMINRRLMLAEAQALGLVVPDQAVVGTVQSNPAFQEAKSFSNSRYQGLVRQMGFASPRDYENYLRQSILIDNLQRSIVDSAVVTDEEVKARFESKYEKRILSALIVNPESLEKGIEVSDEQARAWYESHGSLYLSPLKVELEVVEIDAAALEKNIEISDADIEQAYAERQSEFGSPEKRRISQILVRLARDASDEVRAMAEEKIKAAQQRLAAGESFAKVAKDVSQEPAAAQGGDLGEFEQGSLESELEKVVFEQLKLGEVSEMLTTEFGLSLVKLTAIKPAEEKALAEVRDSLRQQLKVKQAREEAYRLSQDLDNALGMEDSLAAAAAAVNLKLSKLGKLTTDSMLANPLLSASRDLQKQAFTMMPGDAVELVEVSEGHYVALEVKQRFEPETMAYDEVVKRVYDDVRADEARKKAQSIADDILQAAKSGSSIDQLAQNFAQPKYISKLVLRSGEGDDSSWISAVLPAAFRTPEASWVDATLNTDQGVAVVYVSKVKPADAAAFDSKAAEVREEAQKAKGSVRFARWMSAVRDRHEVAINNKVLDRF